MDQLSDFCFKQLNSPIFHEWQTQSANVMAMSWTRASKDDSNNVTSNNMRVLIQVPDVAQRLSRIILTHLGCLMWWNLLDMNFL